MFKLVVYVVLSNSNIIGVAGVFNEVKFVEKTEHSSLELCEATGDKKMAEFTVNHKPSDGRMYFRCSKI